MIHGPHLPPNPDPWAALAQWTTRLNQTATRPKDTRP